jgi:hypothetical protein
MNEVLFDLKNPIFNVIYNHQTNPRHTNHITHHTMRWKHTTHHIINAYYYQWHILKPGGKRKANRIFTVSVNTPKRTEEKANLKGTTGMARLCGSKR